MDDELDRAHRLSKDDLEAMLRSGRPADVGAVRIIGTIRLAVGAGVQVANPALRTVFEDSRVEMSGVRVG